MMTEDGPRTMDGYIRVSRRMGREGPGYISPKIQREAIERWANYKRIQIAEWPEDEDESGGTQERPGLERAVERALAGETDGIVSWKIDRFSRYTEGGLRDLRRLEERGARLAFVVEDIDASGHMGKFVYTVMLAMSEYFLDTIKAGWRTAKSRAIDRGIHIGPTPFGYLRADDGTLEVHPVYGPVVTEAYAIAARDDVHAAAAYLDEHASHMTWTLSTTARFLKNRVYLGIAKYGDLVREHAHDALVTRAIWEAANRNAEDGQRRRAPSATYPLSDVAECGSCRGPMVGGRGGNDNRRMYRCSARCGRSVSISADPLEAYVVDILREAFRHPGFEAGTVSTAVDEATAVLEEAEQELDAFAGDLRARKTLGDERYHRFLQKRADAVEDARDALHAAMDASDAARVVVPDELWDDLSPAELGAVLRGGLESVIVSPGRRPVGERALVVPKGANGDAGALTGADDSQERGLEP